VARLGAAIERGGTPTAVPSSTSPEAPRIEVRCLGEFRVMVDGVERDLQQVRPRHQELLAILAMHPNTWVHRERLFWWLWPDADIDRATRNVQVAISAVRRLVEPDAAPGRPTLIVRNGERYRLVIDDDRCDVTRLHAALRAARAALRAGDVAAAARHLEAALAEWRGEPVPSTGPADWAVELRRQVSHEVGNVAADVVDAVRAAGSMERAVVLAARAVEIDPADDRLWRLAITSANQAGSAALAADLEQQYQAMVAA
jgi:LuxR family maltose regulon positive regulatory protein